MSQAKRSHARLTLIKYFHLFLESKEKKKQGWLTVFYREKLIQEEAGGKATFEKLRRGNKTAVKKLQTLMQQLLLNLRV